MDPLSMGLMTGGANLLSSVFGGLNNNQLQQSMMQQQEAYQTQMSNTAYQRATADMKAAGLNPMMMFGGGSAASTPSVQQAQLQSPIAGAGKAVDSGIQSAMAMKTQNAVIDNLVQQNANLKTENVLKQAQTLTEGSKQDVAGADTEATYARANAIKASMPEIQAAAQRAKNDLLYSASSVGRVGGAIAGGAKDLRTILAPVSDLISSAKDVSRFGDRYGNW